MSSGGSGSEQPHILARAFSCEEPEPTREDNIQNLGSLETGLTELRRNASKLSRDWVSINSYLTSLGGGRRPSFNLSTSCMQPFTPSEACSSPVNHNYGTDTVSLSPLVVNVQDLANWMGVFEAYGEVIRQIIARDIPAEQAQQLESLYDVVSAVLIDYKNLVSFIIKLKTLRLDKYIIIARISHYSLLPSLCYSSNPCTAIVKRTALKFPQCNQTSLKTVRLLPNWLSVISTPET